MLQVETGRLENELQRTDGDNHLPEKTNRQTVRFKEDSQTDDGQSDHESDHESDDGQTDGNESRTSSL